MNRHGFSLVELVVAMLLLAVVLLGLGGATAQLLSTASSSAVELAAINQVDDRIDRILSDPGYTDLETRYEGTETELEGVPGGEMETAIQQVRQDLPNGRVLDYHRITVSLDAPALRRPVSRTITVAAP